jgi:hypothetical protein
MLSAISRRSCAQSRQNKGQQQAKAEVKSREKRGHNPATGKVLRGNTTLIKSPDTSAIGGALGKKFAARAAVACLVPPVPASTLEE